ncbi:MAG: acyl-CoA dehydrogenase family protein [Acidimicrobiia bacterium]
MDLRLPPPDDPRRLEVRRWLAEHPDPSPAELAEAGYAAPAWPPPWGLAADPEHRLVIDEELDAAGIDPHAHNPIGIGWAGPTILAAGSDAQKHRYLGPLLRGEEFWCQLFSEPGSGSDLASLQTRAVRDGDEYVVNGQKIWSTWAQEADFGILLARTDPEAPKQQGISYFLFPMRQAGVEVRPIREMSGGAHFTEVFFTDARVPAGNLVGSENQGWPLAKITLGNERMSLSTGGVLWGMGPRTSDLIDLIRSAGGLQGPERDRAARLYVDAEVMRMLGLKIVSEVIAGRFPGPEAAVKKLLADRHGQEVMDLAADLAGAGGMTMERGPLGSDPGEWPWGLLFSRALTVGGGTAEVLRGIIGERILGLPKEPSLT